MFNANAIRPIALGIAIRDNKLLVMQGYDKKKENFFYRCLGGGIEFGEKSDEALKREFMEELGLEITVKDFLGVDENIFTYNGNQGHELVFFYKIDIKDEDYKEEYVMDDDGRPDRAMWMDINDFKEKKEILYPDNIFKFL